MNDHTLNTLEYPKFLALLQERTASSPGSDFIMKLKPQGSKKRAFQQTKLYRSLLDIFYREEEVPRADFPDIAKLFTSLAPQGSIISLDDFLTLRNFLLNSARIKRFLLSPLCQKEAPLQKLQEGIGSFRKLRDRIDEIFDERDGIRDSASPQLTKIRPEIRAKEQHIIKVLQYLIKSPELADALQERHITTRRNRYVIPVKREEKSKVKGHIHDQSTSGRTLFIEPQSILTIGNELNSLRLDEEREIMRILLDFTQNLREELDNLKVTYKLLTRYDVAYAVCSWAVDYNCTFPSSAANYDLKEIRHPLLEKALRDQGSQDELVSINLKLDDSRVLAITGSNTGGKTVALKTIGLMTLLYQSGFPLPVRQGSSLPFYRKVFADIGDEQSLEQNLSTFSGHLNHIADILKSQPDENTLILLDELGSGTDPVEGGALGCALLDDLAEGNARTFLTTHLGVIKLFVQDHPQMLNASVRFNEETLAPEYVLQVGVPGASHALTIARKLKIPQRILTKASGRLGKEHLRLEKLLTKLDSSQRKLSTEAETALKEREEAAEKHKKLQDELKSLRKERRELLNKAQKEARSIVENANRQMEKLLSKSSVGVDKAVQKEIREEMKGKRAKIEKAVKQTEPVPEKKVKPTEIKEGTVVWVEKLQTFAEITSISNDRKKVRVDYMGMSIDVKTSDLGQAPKNQEAPKLKVETVKDSYVTQSNSAPMELNLIGERVERALTRLDRFIDSSIRAGHDQVTLIHGRGTGILRKALHQHLEKQAHVRQFNCPDGAEDQRGDTVTYIWL